MEVENRKKNYKYCIVPKCKNTTVTSPDKIFITLPKNIKTRKLWQKAMRRTDFVSNNSTKYCCEDHFNLEDDVENYMYYNLVKNVRIKIKPGVVPHIFDCQKPRKSAHIRDSRSVFLKRQRQRDLEEPSTSTKRTRFSSSSSESSKNVSQIVLECSENTERKSLQVNKGVQVNIKATMRSKSVECNILRATTKGKQKQIPSKNIPKTCYSPTSNSSSDHSTSYIPTSDDSSSTEGAEKEYNKKENIEKRTVFLIEKNPKIYIGIPSHSLFIVEMLCARCRLTKIEIFVTLKKIKLNLPYKIIADDFCISAATVCSIIKKTMPNLVEHLKSFIQWKSLSEIQKCLPIPFRARFKNVQCIIDCFEISIQKPRNPILQSFSWSEYKKSNTMKYLIACTPDGIISYVSRGFGGRTTDKMIVEESGFLNELENKAHVMADRGFKHIDELLMSKNNILIRPPSVSAKKKNSKQEVKQSKRIASLRIHVERVISRIREYAILEPHACVHSSLIKYLDNIVIIVCALINLQDYLLK